MAVGGRVELSTPKHHLAQERAVGRHADQALHGLPVIIKDHTNQFVLGRLEGVPVGTVGIGIFTGQILDL